MLESWWLPVLLIASTIRVAVNSDDSPSQWESRSDHVRVAALDVTCHQDRMEVRLGFSGPFYGSVFSKGASGARECIHIEPYTGSNQFEFVIPFKRCGTFPDLLGREFENTVVIQHSPELIDAGDEAKRLRCQWFEGYEKTAAKPPIAVLDLDVVEMDFAADRIDCWLEIQEGLGPWAHPVGGIVPLGNPLTMVVAIRDPTAEFDVLVRSCTAADENGRSLLRLTDESGCVLRPRMMGPWRKLRAPKSSRATVVAFAHFQAFKFPDNMAVFMRCKVMVCRDGCPKHCPKHQPPEENHQGAYADNRAGKEHDDSEAAESVNNKSNNNNNNNKRSFPYKSGDFIRHGARDAFQERASDNVTWTSPATDAWEDHRPPKPRSINDGSFITMRFRRGVGGGGATEEQEVTQSYQAISTLDLAFNTNTNNGSDYVVHVGKPAWRHDVCLTAPRFSAVFIGLGSVTLTALAVASFLLYRHCGLPDSEKGGWRMSLAALRRNRAN